MNNIENIKIQSWEDRLKELCLSGDYPLIHELISLLLIDQKREWVKQEDISYKANSIHERQDFIEEVSEIINSINREGTLVLPQYLREVIIKLLEKNMDIKEISDDSLLDNFKTLENLRKDDGSFDVKLDEQNYTIGRDEIIRRWIYEQEA